MHQPDTSQPLEAVSLASELIKARNDLGLTQSQLSAQSGVSLSAIKSYETGRTMPGSRELRDLCRTLRVTPNRLLFGAEVPFPSIDSSDPARLPGSKGQAVHRNRISTLVRMLSSEESFAIYSLARSIAIARFGEAVVHGDLEMADFMTSIQLLKEGGSLEMDLLPKDPELLRSLAQALKDAVRDGKSTVIPLATSGDGKLKVDKK